MQDQDIGRIVRILSKNLKVWESPIVTHLAEEQMGPYPILISTLS